MFAESCLWFSDPWASFLTICGFCCMPVVIFTVKRHFEYNNRSCSKRKGHKRENFFGTPFWCEYYLCFFVMYLRHMIPFYFGDGIEYEAIQACSLCLILLYSSWGLCILLGKPKIRFILCILLALWSFVIILISIMSYHIYSQVNIYLNLVIHAIITLNVLRAMMLFIWGLRKDKAFDKKRCAN